MWKRNADDPLLRALLDKYHLNLLSVPRENASVGDLYIYDGKRVSPPTSAKYFFDPPLDISPVATNETMADLSGVVSLGVSAGVGFSFLEGFLRALGLAGIVSRMRARYESRRTSSVAFRFRRATRDYLDIGILGMQIFGHKLAKRQAFYAERNRYYVATAVARTPSISVSAFSEDAKLLEVDLGTSSLQSESGVSVQKTGEGEVTFSGPKSLAFGVELIEVWEDPKHGRLGFRTPDEAFPLRDVHSRQGASRAVPYVFLGDPEGDAFLTLS